MLIPIGPEKHYRYGISLNGSLYLFGPFKTCEEAVDLLEDEGFTKVTDSDFIFSPNGRYDAQFAKIQVIPSLVNPEKIKERMRQRTRWGTNNSGEIIL